MARWILVAVGLSGLIAALWWVRAEPARAGEDPYLSDIERIDESLRDPLRAAVEKARSRPELGSNWGELGALCAAHGLHARASQAFERAAGLDSTHPRWPYLAALSWMELGDPAQAEASLLEALSRGEDYAPMHWRLGLTWLEQGRLEEAHGAFDRAIAADPEDPTGWSGRARVRLQMDRTDEALDDLRRSLSLRPGDRYVIGLLGVAYRQAQRPLDAAEPLRIGQGARPSFRDPWKEELEAVRIELAAWSQMRAAQLTEAGRPEESIEILEAVRSERPADVTLLNALGTAYSRARRYDEALTTVDAVLELEPANRQGRLNRATILGNLGRLDEAFPMIEGVIEDHPRYGRAYEVLGALAQRQGDIARSAEAYRSALSLDARNVKVRVGLGLLELQLERWQAAEATLRRAVDAPHPLPDAWVALAMAQLRQGKLEDCRRSLDHLGDNPPSDPRLLAQVRLGLRRADSAEEPR